MRIGSGFFLAGPESTIGDTNVQKTARIASAADPATSINYLFPLELLEQTTVFQVRTYKDNVENESNYRPLTITLDGDGQDVTAILGRGVLLDTEIRAGGIVRLRFKWIPNRSGLQPTQFKAIRTAGPTSPANATITAGSRTKIYEIDTPALSDSAPYTYKLQAVNGSSTLDFLTGITFTADATGPLAPSHGRIELI